ncbi:tRNA lysidine(34) synthetase TilS [Zafaria sp. Z1313]|uniref:tRNA lysidine(34) synthetase TilS n=1 Tax=unclassified Zafaria TaxID=2828765 RepID=UPI002E7963B2|nr:tRNA lysidine(34) synthetase TilS [Zafaria sp. J156]MEE1621408.1 tRNA lysidine(34) synthetase TilS [Zafaria sp. J156]
MGGNLPAPVAAVRNALRAALSGDDAGSSFRPPLTGVPGNDAGAPSRPDGPDVLVACSGGADSLALAAAAGFLARTEGLRAGAVVVDHGLQAGSAEAADRAAGQLGGLGLDPVLLLRADVAEPGTEEQARSARYAAFEDALRSSGARLVLLGHTLDDQAEQVLLGLARGSGTRSVAGMPTRRGPYLRPLLAIRRQQTEAVCRHEGLDYWEDPSNRERTALRNRVRLDVLPFLEDALGPGLAEALARTAALAGRDADHLDAEADAALARVLVQPAEPPGVGAPGSGASRPAASAPDAAGLPGSATEAPGPGSAVVLDLDALRLLGPALRSRVLRLAAVRAGGETPTLERTAALERLAAGTGSAGPVQLAGHVRARRLRRAAPGGPPRRLLQLRREP